MKRDERVKNEIHVTKSIGYTMLWYGMFASLLYRWFYLDQSLSETLDLFIVWLLASIVQFLFMALKGVPMTYPIRATRRDQRIMMIATSLFAGTVSMVILILIEAELRQIIGGLILSTIATLFLFIIYYTISLLWEKSLEE